MVPIRFFSKEAALSTQASVSAERGGHNSTSERPHEKQMTYFRALAIPDLIHGFCII